MRGPAPRWVSDIGWAAAGVAGAFAGIRAMEAWRPAVLGEETVDPETDGVGELTRAYLFSAAAILASVPVAASVRLPRWCGPLGLALEVGGVGLRVGAMRTLRGHYARTLRVLDDQPVVRDGPYGLVRHPGYLGVVLLWLGAALGARNAVAPVLTLVAVGTAYRHRMDAEDALLLRDLPGYAAYAATTPRLVPTAASVRGLRR